MTATATRSRRISGPMPGEGCQPAGDLADLRSAITALQVELRDLRAEIEYLKQSKQRDEFQKRKAHDMAQNLAMQRYGTEQELQTIEKRVRLHEASSSLSPSAVKLVAQVSYMTGWIPFLEFHAFVHKGKICIMPDYKRLVQDSDPGNLTWSFRKMTEQERLDRYIDTDNKRADHTVGVVCELVEINKAKALAAAGQSHLYKPVMGYATVDLNKDQVIAHRDPMKRGEIRALRDALNQTAKGQQAQDHFRDMLRNASQKAELPEPYYDDDEGADAVLLPDVDGAIEGTFAERESGAPAAWTRSPANVARAEGFLKANGLSDADANAALDTDDWRRTPLSADDFKAAIEAYIAQHAAPAAPARPKASTKRESTKAASPAAPPAATDDDTPEPDTDDEFGPTLVGDIPF